jgi:hypothetical protein
MKKPNGRDLLEQEGVLIISNMDEGDDTFDSDVGSWNISRAKRDCKAGKHKLYTFSVDAAYNASKNVEVEAKKVAAMVADQDRLLKSEPLIFAMEDGKVWLIEGNHRINALYRYGAKEVQGWVIEDEDAAPYKLYFNGQRVAPWHRG